MQSSKTSYTDSAFDKFDIKQRLAAGVLAESESFEVDGITVVDLGIFANFMKRITPEKGKGCYVKEVTIDVGATLEGIADADEDLAELLCSAYLYRTEPPLNPTFDSIQQKVANDDYVPLFVNKTICPTVIHAVLAARNAEFTGSPSTLKIWIGQYFIQPFGLFLAFQTRKLNAEDNTTFQVNIGAIVRYAVLTIAKELFKRLVLAYTSPPSTIERRGS